MHVKKIAFDVAIVKSNEASTTVKLAFILVRHSTAMRRRLTVGTKIKIETRIAWDFLYLCFTSDQQL